MEVYHLRDRQKGFVSGGYVRWECGFYQRFYASRLIKPLSSIQSPRLEIVPPVNHSFAQVRRPAGRQLDSFDFGGKR